jgi:hypothetical protein
LESEIRSFGLGEIERMLPFSPSGGTSVHDGFKSSAESPWDECEGVNDEGGECFELFFWAVGGEMLVVVEEDGVEGVGCFG